jgi:hypothetical protein
MVVKVVALKINKKEYPFKIGKYLVSLIYEIFKK